MSRNLLDSVPHVLHANRCFAPLSKFDGHGGRFSGRSMPKRAEMAANRRRSRTWSMTMVSLRYRS